MWALVVVILGCSLVVGPATAFADDWQARSDRTQEVIERYKRELEANPVEGMMLNRLLGHVGRGAGLNALIAEYRQRVEANPNRTNLHLILGHLLKERGDYEDAYVHYDRAVELSPQSPLGWLGRGTIRLLTGERSAAMEDFEEALDRESNRQRRQDILRQLGELSFSQRDFDRGKEFFGRLLAMTPGDRFVREDYVSLLRQYRQLEEALEQYDELLRLAGSNTQQRANTLRDMAEVQEEMGRYDDALATYGQVLRLVSATSWLAREVRTQIVQVYRAAGDLVGFVDAYGSSWERAGADQQLLLAGVYAEMGRLEDALRLYQGLARRDRQATEPRRRIIRILERMGRDDDVPAAYADLIQAAPQRSEFAFELAEYHMRNGDRDQARQTLSTMENRFRNNSYVLLELADTYARYNFDQEARALFERVLQREPDDDMVLIEVGDFFFDRGERQRAIQIWERLPQSQLGQRQGRQRLAEVLVERGILSQGISVFQELLQETPEDEQLLRAMARAMERARRWDEALTTWQTMLEVSEVRQRRQEARARIVEIHQRQNTLRAEIRRWEQQYEGDDEVAAVEAGFFLIEAHLRLREFQQAETRLSEMKDRPGLSPDERASTLLLLEQTYVRSGRYEEAIAVLEELVEERPDMEQELLHRMADHALEARSGEAAVGYAARALEANPNDSRGQARLGDVYRGAGDLEAAARHYQTAIDIDHRAHEVYLKLGQVLRELGRISEAEQALMEVVRSAREEQLIRDAGEAMMSMARERNRLSALEVQWAPLALRMPVNPAHARLMMSLYTELAGPLLLDLYHGGPARQERAAEELYALGGRATTLLVEELQSGDRTRRARGLRLVAELQVEVAGSQLRRMINDDESRTQMAAIAAAARIGDPTLVPALETALEDGAAEVRHLAIWALGHVDSAAAQEVLYEIARGGTEGTAARLAWMGLGSSAPASVRELVGRELARDARGVVRGEGESALVMAAAERIIAAGQGEPYREDLERAARERRDRVGIWAAEALGLYGDARSAEVLWALALEADHRQARRGEAGLRRVMAATSVTPRSVLNEVHYFDWTQSRFDTEGLIARNTRRGQKAPGELEWNDVVDQALVSALSDGLTDGGAALQSRIADDLQGARALPFWDQDRTQRVATAVLDSPDAAELGTDRRTGFALLAGRLDEVGEPAGLDDDALRVALQVMHGHLDGGLVAGLLTEAMNRDDRAIRREALGKMATAGEADAENGMATFVLEQLDAEDPLIQLAAVKAVGRLRLQEAEPRLVELERDAAPTLRRALREARRALGR